MSPEVEDEDVHAPRAPATCETHRQGASTSLTQHCGRGDSMSTTARPSPFDAPFLFPRNPTPEIRSLHPRKYGKGKARTKVGRGMRRYKAGKGKGKGRR